MRNKLEKYIAYALSKTARDTYVLFTGNVLAAFFGFLFTIVLARALSVSDFGVFSASLNLILIIAAISDLGVTPGLIRFVSELYTDNKEKVSNKYLKAGFIIRVVVFILIVLMLLISNYYQKLLATQDLSVVFWVILISFFVTVWNFAPNILISRKKFIKKVVVENTLVSVRLLIAVLLLIISFLSLNTAFWSFFIGSITGSLLGLGFIGFGFMKAKVEKKYYKKLMSFSGWLGLYQVVSTVLNRLDVQILASILGSTATGLYSIPSRLAIFIIVLATSFASALSPRMTIIKTKKESIGYIKKSSLALIPMVILVILWIMLAKPFISILFGDKFISTVRTFQLLSFAMVPYLISVPAFTTIIYTFKKPKYIGVYSVVQLVLVLVLNIVFIRRLGINGPAITFLINNSLYAIYTWSLVFIYLSKDKYVFEKKSLKQIN